MKGILPVTAVVFLSLIGACVAGKCYECNYAKVGNNLYENFLFNYKKDCGPNFKKSNITTTDCDNDCYKAVVEDGNRVCISRGCFPTKGCDVTDANEKFLLECGGKAYQPDLHCCDKGKCNAANQERAPRNMVLLGLFTMVLMMFA